MCDLFPYFTIIGFQGGVYNHFKRDVVTFHSSWASQAGDQLRSETRTEESVTTALEAGFVGENDDILGGYDIQNAPFYRKVKYHSYNSPKLTYSRWWQLNFLLFSPRSLGKKNPFWHIFSTGLKPPTSISLISPPPQKTNMTIAGRSTMNEDVSISYWKCGFSNVMLVFRGVVAIVLPLQKTNNWNLKITQLKRKNIWTKPSCWKKNEGVYGCISIHSGLPKCWGTKWRNDLFNFMKGTFLSFIIHCEPVFW